MCAGRGIIHAEMPVHDPGMPDPRGLQLWIDLPKEFKMVVCLHLSRVFSKRSPSCLLIGGFVSRTRPKRVNILIPLR